MTTKQLAPILKGLVLNIENGTIKGSIKISKGDVATLKLSYVIKRKYTTGITIFRN